MASAMIAPADSPKKITVGHDIVVAIAFETVAAVSGLGEMTVISRMASIEAAGGHRWHPVD